MSLCESVCVCVSLCLCLCLCECLCEGLCECQYLSVCVRVSVFVCVRILTRRPTTANERQVGMAPKEARGCAQRPAHAPVTRPKAPRRPGCGGKGGRAHSPPYGAMPGSPATRALHDGGGSVGGRAHFPPMVQCPGRQRLGHCTMGGGGWAEGLQGWLPKRPGVVCTDLHMLPLPVQRQGVLPN